MIEPVLTRRRALLGGLGLAASGLSGCGSLPGAEDPGPLIPPLPRLQIAPKLITHITVCSRPFRAAGPRLDVETIGDKRVVHNYGHGGSGWSLAWGSSEIAAANALQGGAREIAVIGCGALGLTSAILLQRAGAKVTIYAKEDAVHARSFRASGTWSPDSRIADEMKVDAAFPALWEKMARVSYAAHQTYLTRPNEPVSMTDRFLLRDADAPPPPPIASEDISFAHYGRRLDDIIPRYRDVAPGRHPFPVARVRTGRTMQFNITELSRQLTADFVQGGGRIQTTTFHTPADFAALREPVIVNCTGYGARALFNDESIVPVRGQIAWLAPQPAVRYGLIYRDVSIISRTDGVVVQQTGRNEMYGYGVADETPDRAESDAAVAAIRSLYDRPVA